jgi:hypothetical protein
MNELNNRPKILKLYYVITRFKELKILLKKMDQLA